MKSLDSRSDLPPDPALMGQTGVIKYPIFTPQPLRGIVFTHGVRMGERAAGKSLSGLYLSIRKV